MSNNISEHPLYMRHYHMMRRCYDDTFPAYAHAGAIGLKVCDRWHNIHNYINDIENTYGLPPNRHSQLARKNPDIGWYPSNIVGWTDHQFIANHRKDNMMITYKKQTKSLADWSRESGIKASTLWNRIERGYTPEQAFSKPINKGIKVK